MIFEVMNDSNAVTYKGRSFSIGDQVEVYRNLHKEMLSIRKNGLIVAHAPMVLLNNVTFHVSESGRNRVLKEKRKNVHAYVKGELDSVATLMTTVKEAFSQFEKMGYTRIYYNPYKVSHFVDYETMEPITKVKSAYVILDRIYVK